MKRVWFTALLLVAAGCRGRATRDAAAVDAALAQYSQLLLRMDHHGLAQLFAPDGVLEREGGAPLQGPDAIETFLRGFDAYHVLAYSAIADTTLVSGRTAHQTGAYRQRVQLPSRDTVEVHGRFRIEWRKRDDRWRIERMGTAAGQ